MTIHEFGKENEQVIVLVHPSVVMWDYFEYVIPLLEKKYHLIIPALPGYDPDVKADVEYIKKAFPHTIFRKIKDAGHGGLAPFNPELFVRGIERACKEGLA